MADNSAYVAQLDEACRLIAERVGVGQERWKLVYQSRSGRPSDPWLEPDIIDHLRELHERRVADVVVHPVGFLSDHIEVLYDLDEEAQAACAALGLNMVRSATVGKQPAFISMLGALVEERARDSGERPVIGRLGPGADVCPADCCLPPSRPPRG
jgi:ferrochelatase